MSNGVNKVTVLMATAAVIVGLGVSTVASGSGGGVSQPGFGVTTGVPGERSEEDGNIEDDVRGGTGPACEYVDAGMYRDAETGQSVSQPGPGTESYTEAWCEGLECPDGMSPGITAENFVMCGGWLPYGRGAPAVTVDDLVAGAYDEARGRIPLPVVDLAPPVDFGTLVHVPVWLAVEPAGPFSARAQVGDVWAQVDVTFAGVTWDMGDGSIVECETFGTVWAGEVGTGAGDWPESPDCGYTYEVASFPEYTADGANVYHLTVTTHWSLRLTGSDGRDEMLDSIDEVFEFDYQVFELQTVGHDD